MRQVGNVKSPSLLDTVFGGYSNVQVENNLCRLNARSHHVEYVLVDTNVRTIIFLYHCCN